MMGLHGSYLSSGGALLKSSSLVAFEWTALSTTCVVALVVFFAIMVFFVGTPSSPGLVPKYSQRFTKKLKSDVNKFLSDYRNGSTATVVVHSHHFFRAKDERTTLWAEENLVVEKAGRFFVVRVNDQVGVHVHSHYHVKFVGVRAFLRVRWFRTDFSCYDNQFATAPVRDMKTPFWAYIQDKVEYFSTHGKDKFAGFNCYQWSTSYMSEYEHEEKINFAPNSDWVALHDLYCHPDDIDPGHEWADVPVEFIKKLNNLPDKAYELFTCRI